LEKRGGGCDYRQTPIKRKPRPPRPPERLAHGDERAEARADGGP